MVVFVGIYFYIKKIMVLLIIVVVFFLILLIEYLRLWVIVVFELLLVFYMCSVYCLCVRGVSYVGILIKISVIYKIVIYCFKFLIVFLLMFVKWVIMICIRS